MKKVLCNKKNVGIYWATLIMALFAISALWMLERLHNTPVLWFVCSSAQRLVFGIAILFLVSKIHGRTKKDILSFKNSKMALAGGIGYIVVTVYTMVLLALGAKAITDLTVGLFVSQILMQQITTGFFEELTCRLLLLEGYFYGPKSLKRKLLYAMLSFVFFGVAHVVTGWDLMRFLHTGICGFAFGVMYLKSRNIIIPMILHFVYDIFANMLQYIGYINSKPFFILYNLGDAMYIVMFGLSLIMLLMKDKEQECEKEN